MPAFTAASTIRSKSYLSNERASVKMPVREIERDRTAEFYWRNSGKLRNRRADFHPSEFGSR
jgi:hypothetical protein